jgi:hypothetical protein
VVVVLDPDPLGVPSGVPEPSEVEETADLV